MNTIISEIDDLIAEMKTLDEFNDDVLKRLEKCRNGFLN